MITTFRRVVYPVALALLSTTFTSPAQAQQVAADTKHALVAQTGQTTSYAAGDDGALQAGVTWSPATRFTDNANGTITDNLTKLIWLKNANCPVTPTGWAGALAYVTELNSSGTMNGNNCGDTSKGTKHVHQTDWRLPNRNELASLLDMGYYNPALPGGVSAPFTDFTASPYWSSTYSAQINGTAWLVFFYGGNVENFDINTDGYVIAVRGA